MRFLSVETTPNPNSMKLNLSERRTDPAVTYTRDQRDACPEVVAELLGIEGVQSVFLCADFLTLSRDPKADWKSILAAATEILEGEQAIAIEPPESLPPESAAEVTEVTVSVQTFRGIPIQIKVSAGQTVERLSTGPRFMNAIERLQSETGADFLSERRWEDRGARYGTPRDVAQNVLDEFESLLDDEQLERMIVAERDKSEGTAQQPKGPNLEEIQSELESADWRQRLRAVQRVGISELAIPFLIQALGDPKPQVRRWAAVSLGGTDSPRAVEPLCAALADRSVAVRRTAGDSLSDLANPAAEEAMVGALKDSNKLVRWRAARFLYEIGSESVLPALEAASGDPAFEVNLEIEAAMDRIRGGSASQGPAWRRMTQDG